MQTSGRLYITGARCGLRIFVSCGSHGLSSAFSLGAIALFVDIKTVRFFDSVWNGCDGFGTFWAQAEFEAALGSEMEACFELRCETMRMLEMCVLSLHSENWLVILVSR